MKDPNVQTIVLRTLSQPGTDRRLGRGQHYLPAAVRGNCPPDDKPSAQQIMAAIWSLLARGLVYIDISQPAPANWKLVLTDVGRKALKDEEVNPDDPSGYLSRLYEDIPQISEVVRPYLKEAVNTYYHESYLASTVMLGVAAEAIFLELADSFVSWKGRSADKLRDVLSNPKTVYLQKFVEFRKRLDTEKTNLPSQSADRLDLYMDSVLDLLRTSRNEAGHPTGRAIQRDDCFTNLRIFARLAKRMYELKHWFDNNKPLESSADDSS